MVQAKFAARLTPVMGMVTPVLPNAEFGITLISMTTVTAKVPREMAQKLELAAARKRVSKSKIIRDALDNELKNLKKKPSLYDLMKDRLGKFGSGKSDLATNPKHMEGYGQWRR